MERELEAARQELEAARAAARQAKLDHAKAPEKAGSSLSAWFEVRVGVHLATAGPHLQTRFADVRTPCQGCEQRIQDHLQGQH